MTTNSIDLNQRQPLEILKEKISMDTREATERSAKDIILGGFKGFLLLFGSIFGSIITSDALKINVVIVLFLFAFMSLSGLFLYFNRQDKREIKILKRDQLIMAKSQLNIVDTMEVDFKIRLDQAMTNIEQRYGDTITGLTCQMHDLMKIIIEERDQISTLLTVMTTEFSNGMDRMTTECEDT